MLVKELIELLKNMPQDLEVQLFAPYYGECDVLSVSIQKGCDEHKGKDVVVFSPYKDVY